ncbi:Tuberculostearic acid methyltransferase UfaA1 [Usitatibacter rugosus]|uniref:Tuberculostearic acid methyltransferase UfaA1 n=1 Tax=Usitatibacter rugosus TaxID=2732067 RepID=A0A6M4GRA9_9PROT|nr:cyclopropane-fatty-acyl-phospholipid synthase family protein [Usitatibacter rugosus]QJR09595.1 Tuberculostearic acid methyltransferase UfaA1 [Usitatibacter rugosus]
MSAKPIPFVNESVPIAARGLFRILERLQYGRLSIELPDGSTRTFQGREHGPDAQVVLRDWGAIATLLRKSEIGVAECWRDGRLATPDMTAFLMLCARNEKPLADVFYGNPIVAFMLRCAHALRANTRSGAKKNIHAHYDLGNDFYKLWLDPSMTYSSAVFSGQARTMQEAQEAKYERILATLGVEASHQVLEIGCGWGGFAEYAARTRGCHVTGITISRAQLEYAQARIQAAGLEAFVHLRFCDYRDLAGQYDRVVSIEMVEAVGERYWPEYFATIQRSLKAGGRACIQAITIDEAAFEQYRKTSDFIREYIFPGGMLFSVERATALAKAAGLEAREPFRFGPDYAETLRRWRTAIDSEEGAIRKLGFDDAFLAIWRFYLHYCEAGFDVGRIDVVQMELAKN